MFISVVGDVFLFGGDHVMRQSKLAVRGKSLYVVFLRGRKTPETLYDAFCFFAKYAL